MYRTNIITKSHVSNFKYRPEDQLVSIEWPLDLVLSLLYFLMTYSVCGNVHWASFPTASPAT